MIVHVCLIFQLVHKQLGVQIIGLLVDVEQREFERRLEKILTLLLKCLNHDEMSEITEDKPEEEDEDNEERDESSLDPITGGDHLIFNTLVTMEKIFTECGINTSNSDLYNLYYNIWGKCIPSEYIN